MANAVTGTTGHEDVGVLGEAIEQGGGQLVVAEEPAKNAAAVALGRMGGLKGGTARARSLSKKRRAEIAKKAAKARWRT